MSANGLATEAVSQLSITRSGSSSAPTTNNALAIDNTLSALSMYIPAEAMALYLAISSSLPVIITTYPKVDPHDVYWCFVWGVSPFLFLLAYFAKIANRGLNIPNASEFPWFRLAASIIAFGVWGRCVPGNPFAPATEPGAGIAYGILATIVSIVLPSLESICNWLVGIYERKKKKPEVDAARDSQTPDLDTGGT